jgi:hypothetical protein
MTNKTAIHSLAIGERFAFGTGPAECVFLGTDGAEYVWSVDGVPFHATAELNTGTGQLMWPFVRPGAPTMEASQYAYREGELSNVDAMGEYPAKIQITSDGGSTKHLNITATEFEQIKAVLLDYRLK